MMKQIVNIIIVLFLSLGALAQDIDKNAYFKALNFVQTQKTDSAILILNTKPDCYECQKLLSQIYYKNGDFLRSIRILKSVENLYPAETNFELARIFAKMGFAEESVAYLEKHFDYKNPKFYSEILSYTEFDAINTSSEWREFWSINRYSKNALKLEEAIYLSSQKKSNEALQILLNLKYSTAREIINYRLALIYYEIANYSEASKHLQTAIEQSPKYIDAINLKLKIELATDKNDAALLTNSKLLEIDIFTPQHLVMQANLLLKNNNTEQALTYVNEFLKYFPTNEEATHLKTIILTKDQNFRQALIELNILIDKNPSEKDYFVQRGDIYYKLESWRFAANDYSMALDIYPNLAEVWYHYGMCQFNLNDKEKACHAWQKAANMKNRAATKMLYNECGL
ncbi:MAG: tetratricopeptide repeat protein [Bacteroidales bacterium]|nr:tetratricopeptide repeat protein [Bacteroidales bacterium]MDD4215905.1 tetratricopeptide repeat protein [Bacteroidales bacterium]